MTKLFSLLCNFYCLVQPNHCCYKHMDMTNLANYVICLYAKINTLKMFRPTNNTVWVIQESHENNIIISDIIARNTLSSTVNR